MSSLILAVSLQKPAPWESVAALRQNLYSQHVSSRKLVMKKAGESLQMSRTFFDDLWKLYWTTSYKSLFFVTSYCNYYRGGREVEKKPWRMTDPCQLDIGKKWYLHVSMHQWALSCLLHSCLCDCNSCISNGVSIWMKVPVQTLLDISSVKRR